MQNTDDNKTGSPLMAAPEIPVLEEAREVKRVETNECATPATAATTVAAVCVDVVDLGVRDTRWGRKPQLKLVFELGELNANGYPDTAIRTFTKSLHEKSALRPALETWLGRPLDGGELTKGFSYAKLIGMACTLTLLPAISESGNGYDKIIAITPAGEPELKPSGTYRRWTNQEDQ